MHPIALTMFGLIGMSVGAWLLHDMFNVIIIGCMVHVHRVSQTRWVESHNRILCNPEHYEVLLEEFTETTIEVVGPFINE